MGKPGDQDPSGNAARNGDTLVPSPAGTPPSPPKPDDADPFVGQIIAERYRVESVLGQGGMGTVYLCEHIQLRKRMALKVLADEFRRQPELVARFLKEARAAAQIGHANIVDVYDLGELAGGGAFIAMALLEGDDLHAELQRAGAMPFARARVIVGQICRALAAAHHKGIIHRDLKPANVFLARDADGVEQVKILDFGIAQVLDADGEAVRLTQTGAIVGTPAFMSPEQGRGLVTDHRTDIYSVGCILYNLITGELVFDGHNLMGVITSHLFEPPVPPSQRAPAAGISPDLDALVLRALAKDPADRFQTMKEMWVALEALVDDPMAWPETNSGRFPATTSLKTPAPASRTSLPGVLVSGIASSPPSRRNGLPLLLGSIVVGACLAGGAWTWLSRKPAPPAAIAPAVVSEVSLDIRCGQPDAQATIRGRSYPLPLHASFSMNKDAEMVEVSASGFSTHGMWIRFDRDQSLEVALDRAPPAAVSAAASTPSAAPIAVAAAPARPSLVPRAAAGAKSTHGAPATASPTVAPPIAVAATPEPPRPAPVAAAAPATTTPPATPPVAARPTAPLPPLVLGAAVVQRQMQAHRSAVDACIAEDPSASGHLGYRLLIGADGRVTSAQLIEAEHRYPAIERCLVRTLSGWTFSPAPGRAAEARCSLELD